MNLFRLVQRKQIGTNHAIQEDVSGDCVQVCEAWIERSRSRSPHTAKASRAVLREWQEFLGSRDILDATRKHVLKFLTALSKRDGRPSRIPGQASRISPNTIGRKIVLLKGCYDYLISAELYSGENPFAIPSGITKERLKRPTEPVPAAKVKEMLALAGPRDRAILALLFGAGLRRAELVGLRFGHVVGEGARFSLRKVRCKGGKFRDFELPEFVCEALAGHLGRHTGKLTKHVFTHTRKNKPMSCKTIYRIFKDYCTLVGLDDTRYSPHSSRASLAVRMDDQKIGIRHISRALGHSNVSTTHDYMRMFLGEEDPIKKVAY